MIKIYAFYRILGLPLLAWGGIFTIIILILTALVAYLNVNNIKAIAVKWHVRLAYLTIILALIHGIIAILAFLI